MRTFATRGVSPRICDITERWKKTALAFWEAILITNLVQRDAQRHWLEAAAGAFAGLRVLPWSAYDLRVDRLKPTGPGTGRTPESKKQPQSQVLLQHLGSPDMLAHCHRQHLALLMMVALVTAEPAWAAPRSPAGHATAQVGKLERPYEDPLQQEIRFGQWSYDLAPWRAYMDTWPAAQFLNCLGLNFNVPWEDAEATAEVCREGRLSCGTRRDRLGQYVVGRSRHSFSPATSSGGRSSSRR